MLGTSGTLEGEYPFDLIKGIPYIGILVVALMGVNVLIVLISGIILAAVISIQFNFKGMDFKGGKDKNKKVTI